MAQTSDGRASLEELFAIAELAAAHLERPYAEHAQLLYDENGLPKSSGAKGEKLLFKGEDFSHTDVEPA